MIQRFLCGIDIYGAKVEFNFNKKRIHNTNFGGILTITVIFIFFLGCWFQSKNLITRESPTIINSMRSVLDPERVYLNKNNITFMVQITDSNGRIVNDPRIINVYAVQESMENSIDENTISQTAIQMENCSLDSIGNEELLPYFTKFQYKKMYCFSNINPNIFIEGDYDSNSFSQIFVYVQKCQNTTDINKPTCLPTESINDILKNSKLSIFMSDQYFDPYSFDQPLKFRGINLYTLTSSLIPKELQIYFMNQYIQDDVGLIVNDISEKHGFFYNEYKDIVFYTENNILARILLRMAKHKESFITRKYLKFTDVIGQLGGLLKILMTLGSILCVPFVRLHLHKAIVNEIFNFKFVQENKQKRQNERREKKSTIINPTVKSRKMKTLSQQIIEDKNKDSQFTKSQKFIRSKSRSKQLDESKNENQSARLKQGGDGQLQEQQSCCLDSNQTIKKRKTIIETAKTIFVVTKKIISYGFIDYIIHFLFPRSKSILRKKMLVDQSINRIFDHLDVLYLLNKMLEIEKLKKILLNEDQLRLFEFIPKPEIEEDKLKWILGAENDNQPKDLETNTILNRGKIEIIENGKIQDSEIFMKKNIETKNLYDLYFQQKTPAEKALDAYQGLVNILKKEKKSDRDNKLIDLIDPSILEQYQVQINEFEKKNNNFIQMNQSIPILNLNHKFSNLDQSDEDLIGSALNFGQKVSNQPLRSSCFQSNRNILNQLKFTQQATSYKEGTDSDYLSTHLTIPQENREISLLINQGNSQQINPFFKSLKDLNNIKKSSFEEQPQRKRTTSLNDSTLSTSLTKQKAKQNKQKKLYQN